MALAFRRFLADTGDLWLLARSSVDRLILGPFRKEPIRFRALVLQTVQAGINSLPLVALISLLMGMIMALQSAYQLEKLGAVNLVASLVAISVVRELAPLMTAIIVAGRFGSAIAAELATMKISQEIDALTVMGIDTTSYLVVPRLGGLLISLPSLTIFSGLVGILGGLVVAVTTLGLGSSHYITDALDALQFQDIFTGVVKSFAFATIIGLVACQCGLRARGGPDAVGRATTKSVVRSIVLIIAADLFVTAIFYLRG